MRIPRFYTSHKLLVGKECSLDAQTSHHICSVLRMKQQAKLVLFNGTGGEYQAELRSPHKSKAIVYIHTHAEVEHESNLRITLAQCISKGTRMDYAIQKSIELGVHRITPLIAQYNAVKLDNSRLEKKHAHWEGIAISACEQSGRNRIPKIDRCQRLATWITSELPNCRIILDPNASTPLKATLCKEQELVFLIGPEGGLAEAETELARQHGFVGIKLGPRTLRTETACVAALSNAQLLWGDLGLHH